MCDESRETPSPPLIRHIKPQTEPIQRFNFYSVTEADFNAIFAQITKLLHSLYHESSPPYAPTTTLQVQLETASSEMSPYVFMINPIPPRFDLFTVFLVIPSFSFSIQVESTSTSSSVVTEILHCNPKSYTSSMDRVYLLSSVNVASLR